MVVDAERSADLDALPARDFEVERAVEHPEDEQREKVEHYRHGEHKTEVEVVRELATSPVVRR